MSKFSLLLSSLAVFFLAMGLAGCPGEDMSAPIDNTNAAVSDEAGHEDHDHAPGEGHDDADEEDHEGHDHAPGEGHDDADDADEEEGSSSADEDESTSTDPDKEEYLADLSDEDRALVEEQKICPVSEESLWGMATPVKIAVTDAAGVEHQIFVCCGGCKGKVEADPDKYLAVLEK